MVHEAAVVMYYKTSQIYFYTLPSYKQLTVVVQRGERESDAAKRWIEAQGFKIVDLSTFLTKSGSAVLCEVEKPSDRALSWHPRTDIVHGSQFNDALSVLIQMAHDRITGKGQKY